jgi:hypothetical protein
MQNNQRFLVAQCVTLLGALRTLAGRTYRQFAVPEQALPCVSFASS